MIAVDPTLTPGVSVITNGYPACFNALLIPSISRQGSEGMSMLVPADVAEEAVRAAAPHRCHNTLSYSLWKVGLRRRNQTHGEAGILQT